MRPSHSLDRLDVAMDDDRLVADAGLLLPATLAHHLRPRELVDEHLDLGGKPGGAIVARFGPAQFGSYLRMYVRVATNVWSQPRTDDERAWERLPERAQLCEN